MSVDWGSLCGADVTDAENEEMNAEVEMLCGTSDPEYRAKLDAERCTLQFGQASGRKLDAGRLPMEESPLFGGEKQGGLF